MSGNHPIRVILADDHILLRSGLKMLLEARGDITVVGEAGDGREALALLDRVEADVLVLDLSMPGMSGLDCIKEIKSRQAQPGIVVLTMHYDENYIREVMKAGAMAYVQKGAVDTELFQAITQVAAGKLFISPGLTQTLLTALLGSQGGASACEDDPYHVLSAREREVLRRLAHGYAINEIAAELALSVKTVETYKARIMDKLGFSRRSELVSYALKHGMLS